MAAYHVEHLHWAEAVNDAIDGEGESGRRFGRSGHDDCARFDAVMAAAAERVGPVAALIAVDIDEVQDFNVMYELQDKPCTVMFFYRYSYVHVRGFRSSDHVNNWAAITSADEFADVVGVVHQRATAGYRSVDFGHGV
ncbi:hypothetical protein BDA96_07G235000 [Sorghum bicolor]|uniref:Thioredoxin domain-containing protein n=1 Tax=Sorghum bicolor TaxID=4558 RepID=A0A921UBQ6_SORBI|nr:thioredoxin-like protein YLS8 [Sorghum bicolor]KAG0524711.1 hypothetical protein BDA96_07G235000 [Sorghum bicolor]|eukprot:XP_002444824.1 thioredoxin-like protein YLS8 [Sorghum bicolor]